MTNDEINRLIAEELGWKPYRHRRSDLWSLVDTKDNLVGRYQHGGISEDHCWAVCNLDFCNDYNAVAEMRKAVRPEEMDRFVSGINGGMESLWSMMNATPRQQAEAFLRMRGKWVDA